MRSVLIRPAASALASLLLVWSSFSALAADAPRWLHLDPAHMLFSDQAPAAAIVYPNRLARLAYVTEAKGWLATLVISAPGPVTQLSSRLIFRDGTSASLRLNESRMATSYDQADRFATLRFSVTAQDVERFQAAENWLLETPFGQVDFSLSGSRRALNGSTWRI